MFITLSGSGSGSDWPARFQKKLWRNVYHFLLLCVICQWSKIGV